MVWLFVRLFLVIFLFIVIQVPVLGEVASANEPAPVATSPTPAVQVLTHDLIVELVPGRHQLLATDRMVVQGHTENQRELAFSLNSMLRVHQIVQRNGEDTAPLSFAIESESGNDPHVAVQRVIVTLGPSSTRDHTLTLEWIYAGVINDPPREPRHLRFVTPSETAGHIGPEGVYLSAETHWYPHLPGSIPTYRVTITTPKGWQAVSHGRLVADTIRDHNVTAEWEVTTQTEALTLVANRFVKQQRLWNGVEVAAYLFPEEASLADEYLEASVRYLEVYTKLLGPYPFPKFAVVENFFASGLGMPSFTLLGSGVVKRHYVQPYALGHEIVHSWIGNWVFNDGETGNWVEGLTTYLANYYYDELTGPTEQARAQRRMMLLGYAIYVRWGEDYPVGRFRHKTDQKDNAIGYQKAAMIFHMLRREIGDAAFWQGVRKLIADFGGSHATWKDIEGVFERTGRRDLRWFFAQWVEQQGAPTLVLSDVQTVSVRDGDDKPVAITVRLTQKGSLFHLRLPVRIIMRGGQISLLELDVHSTEQTFTIPVAARPVSFEVDPEFEVFRLLDRRYLPPMLNLFVTDYNRLVVLPSIEDSTAKRPYHDLAARIESLDALHNPVVVKTDRDLGMSNATEWLNGSILVLGGPDQNRLTEWAIRGCGNRIRLEGEQVIVDEKTYEGMELSVLVSCRHPDRPDHVVSVFYGQTPSASSKVARVLFFYGWQSYMVFRDGAVVARGDFPPKQNELEIRFNAH